MQKLDQELGWTERQKAVIWKHFGSVTEMSNGADFKWDMSGTGFGGFTEADLMRQKVWRIRQTLF